MQMTIQISADFVCGYALAVVYMLVKFSENCFIFPWNPQIELVLTYGDFPFAFRETEEEKNCTKRIYNHLRFVAGTLPSRHWDGAWNGGYL